MSDDLFGGTPPVLRPNPSALTRRAESLYRNADEQGKALEGQQAELAKQRESKFKDRQGEREQDMGAFKKSSDDLIATSAAGPAKVPMPDANLGPLVDPTEARNFMFGVLGMALVGAKGGRQNFKMSLASMNGALKGYQEGNLDRMKSAQDDFKRNFDIAMEKQRQATSQYDAILKSKTLSLNQQMELIAMHASANQDWALNNAARAKDLDRIYKQVGEQRTAADRLLEKAATIQEKMEARREKAAEKEKAAAAGNQGLSEKYKTDADYRKRVDFWAQYMKDGNSLPPRFAQSGAGKAMYSDIISAVPTLGSGDSKEMRAGAVELAGQKSQARALGTRTAAIEQAASEAREMSSIVVDTSSKFSRTDFPPVNAALAAFYKNTGDVKVRQFGASVNSYINAYARAVNPNGTGTVSDKEHAREMLSTADSHEQVVGILAVLDREMTAAQHSPKNVKKSLRDEITGGGEGGGAAPSKNAKGWTLHTDAQGNKAYVSPDGKQFEELK